MARQHRRCDVDERPGRISDIGPTRRRATWTCRAGSPPHLQGGAHRMGADDLVVCWRALNATRSTVEWQGFSSEISPVDAAILRPPPGSCLTRLGGFLVGF